MDLLNRLAQRLGYTPTVRAQAQQLSLSSPWVTSNPLQDATLAALYQLGDQVPVTRLNALSLGTVAAGRQIIAGTGGRIPLISKSGSVRMPQPPQLLTQPERGLSRSTSLTWLMDDLIFYPCSWWHVLERDSYGWPTWVERPSHAEARVDSEGRLIGIGDRSVKPENVIRFDSPSGEGLLLRGKRAIRRGIAIELAAALAEDNPVPAIELHDENNEPLSQADIDVLVDSWTTKRRQRGAAYTPKSITVKTLGTHPENLLIDGRKALSLELVRHMALPAWAASTAVEGATMTYDNRSMRNWELIDLTLAPYFAAVADRLSMPDVTPRGWTVEFDLEQLTRPDMKTRFETYGIGLDKGFIDQQWIDAQEGAPMKGTR